MLTVHRSTDAAALVRALADVLREPPPGPVDPFAVDRVAVGARGTERWIAQSLSHHLGAAAGSEDGICARVEFSSPARLLDDVMADALARTAPGHVDSVARWAPESMTWSVLEVLGALEDDPSPRFAALGHHLRTVEGEQGPRVRRIAVAARLARLLNRYGAARPELLRAWAGGSDELPPGASPDLGWQPELFRRVRAAIDLPAPAELLPGVCAAVASGAVDVPSRVGVFVVTRLPSARLQLLSALAGVGDVHLFLQHPSPALWAAVERSGAAARPRSPLLASLATDARELQVRLDELFPQARVLEHPGPGVAGDTTLAALQRSLAGDDPAGSGAVLLPDASVQVHACHGRARQVEVLREVLLGLLDADPTLQPRDVIVMCPDVEAFAPLVQAAFAGDDLDHPGARLRVQIADRSALQTNPLLALAAHLLRLAQGRVGVGDVLDLAGGVAVRRRFRLEDEDLEQLRVWVVDASVHWGLSAEHRAAWHLGGLGQGSWRAGLDRLLVGVALGGGGEELLGEGEAVVPLDDVESSRVDLAGRVAELLDRVEVAVGRLTRRQSVARWCEALLESVLDLGEAPPDSAWWVTQLRSDLGAIAERAARAGTAEVGLADVAQMIDAEFAGRPQRSNFRTGAVTVCTLTPMRAVPHRVVVLLGMDDGAFPRVVAPDADDALAGDHRPGDRDPRNEDRQVLLDAITSARDHLVVTYGGRDVRSGAELPPAVPVGELLDALEALQPGARDAVVTVHPLQPTDPRNFSTAATDPGRGRAFSYDRTAHAGALAAAAGPRAPGPFLPAPLPPAPREDLDLDRLVQFWQNPTQGFLTQRLDVALATREEEPDPALPVELDGLQKWAIGDRVLAARRAGLDPAAVRRREAARGSLPPGVLAEDVLREIGPRADRLAEVAARFDTAPAHTVDLELDLDVSGVGPVRLTGTVRGVRPVPGGGRASGVLALTTTYSRVRAKQVVRAWIELLALTAADPGTEQRTVVVGRGDRDSVSEVVLGPLDPVQARGHLHDLLQLRHLGLTQPLPLPVETTHAWARRDWRGAPADGCVADAERSWVSGHAGFGEDREEAFVRVHGPRAPISVLTSWQAPPGSPPGLPPTFAELARRIWQPILGAKTETTR
ncbi:exodeoxyribonuclease V subunit gamma [Kineococcus gynurae]|uniref:RecBCD enzyme subunit RecC n=1 Tax=Kineococcus gynurae TaxID=452979 RepID=A0ABV5LNY3_9ACTN